MYPVDLPPVEDTELMSASELYLSSLNATPCNNKWFESSQTSKVAITTANIRPLRLFEDNHPACEVLALHPPEDPSQVVALYLHDKWWRLDNVLRTSSKSRSGLVSAQSIIERLIVFLLSQVAERPSPPEQVLFSLHPRSESCKVLWTDNQAVGFYTVKHKGSLCDGWSSCCYLLPVLDTLLVRRSCRRRGFGLQILEDFCSSFSSEEFLGLSSPLSPSMAAVVRRFLQQHEEQRERLYEVEAPGGWTQRRNIWLNIQLGRYSSKQQECAEDSAPFSTCNMNTPLVAASAELHMNRCDVNHGERSPSSEISETGCFSAAHYDGPDLRSHNRPRIREWPRRRRMKSKIVSSRKHSGENSVETEKWPKRARRTKVNL
ncbi:protein FAM169B isoform X1 [Kryptolebias marmoratus]|uniref:Protein FAM169B-like n=1 Tax=Kryptolebias marmoratus TaxID=37003 RepID=A0A3Q2ZWC4_KRYMA|nr:protein FAM169B isoform X1 [Kryptolebias marmoratus]